MTRIVAGALGGRRLDTPPGPHTRPTSDRVREALFNTLETLTGLAGVCFADLYAGSGAVGLEAYSRGAGHVLLVESDQRAARIIRGNIAALHAAPAVRLAAGPVARVLGAGPPDNAYQIVFADPPYAVPQKEISATLAALAGGDWLAPGAVVVLERSSRGEEPTWPSRLTPVRARRYGETILWYARAG